MGVMMSFEPGWPRDREDPKECPACHAEVAEEDLLLLRSCEWCGLPGCDECMTATVDGWVCGEEACGEKLKKYHDEINAEKEI